MMTNVVDTKGEFLYGTSRARPKQGPAVDYRGAAVDSTRAIAVRSIVVDDSRRPRAVQQDDFGGPQSQEEIVLPATAVSDWQRRNFLIDHHR
jgi:hypothetical protein